jgi:hypothetical protein
MEFMVLYTHQKTKKHKVWQDGRLHLDSTGNMAYLFDESGKKLERFPVRKNQVVVGVDLECERYLLTVESSKSTDEESSAICMPDSDSHSDQRLKRLTKHRKKSFHCPRRVNHRQSPCSSVVLPDAPTDCSLTNTYFGTMCNSVLDTKLIKHVNQRISNWKQSDKENIPSQTTSDYLPCTSEQRLYQDPLIIGSQLSCLATHDPSDQNEKGFAVHLVEQRSPKRDSKSILSLLGMNMSHEIPTGKATNSAGLSSADNPTASSCFYSSLFDEPNRLQDHPVDHQQSLNDSLLNEAESWELNDLFPENNEELKVPEFDCSVDILDRTERVHDSEESLTREHDHTSNSFFTGVSPIESNSVNKEHVPKSSSIGFNFLPQRAQNLFKPGCYTLPQAAKKGSVHKRSLGLQRPRNSSQLSDCCSHKLSRQGVLSTVTEVCKSIGQSMISELHFPSVLEWERAGSGSLSRQMSIPITFSSIAEYKHVFVTALQEHLNIILMSIAQLYHTAKRQANLTSYVTGAEVFVAGQTDDSTSAGPSCRHGVAKLKSVKKDGPNKGRLFYGCQLTGPNSCQFFKWADQCPTKTDNRTVPGIVLQSPDSINSFFRNKGVAFYCECEIIRKGPKTDKQQFFKKRWSRCDDTERFIGKRALCLKLQKKQDSSCYSKGDLWAISKNFDFSPGQTFLAQSTFFGPSSSGEIEIEAISGYSQSNWTSGTNVHAILVCNASSELAYIDTLKSTAVSTHTVPILPYLLSRDPISGPSGNTGCIAFRAPIRKKVARLELSVTWDEVEQLAQILIHKYNLNQDQQSALMTIAKMVCPSTNEREVCIQLIHGVFGSGKSFLLAITVLFLNQLFELDESVSSRERPLSLLITSTTNVAVDRILLNLLEMGFEDFVRVGSARKMAKSILPYSVHSKEVEDNELWDLQNMLKTDLSSTDRMNVKKSIERLKRGENLRRLSAVRVVGATCAACLFSTMDNMLFPILLLDECSQMLEPGSLLPMTRFACEKLVLVGDPKQLGPPLVGAIHDKTTGLEQTLFDRLVKMGIQPTVLRTQYRCHPAISNISSSLFYDDMLINGVKEIDRSPLVKDFPTLCFYNVSKGREKSDGHGSFYNEKEADFVVTLALALLHAGVNAVDIGLYCLS